MYGGWPKRHSLAYNQGMESHVYTGRLNELALLITKLKGNPRVKIELLPEEEGEMLPFGIFKEELKDLKEEDFALAEWHGPKDDEF